MDGSSSQLMWTSMRPRDPSDDRVRDEWTVTLETFLSRLGDAGPDLGLAQRTSQLEMADHAGIVHEERARKAEDAEAARRLAVRIEHRLKPVQTELLEERRDLVTRLLEIHLEEHHIRLRRRDALEGRHFLAAGLTPGGPEVDHDRLPAEIREAHDLTAGSIPFEVRSVRGDPPARTFALDLRPDDPDVRRGRRRSCERERRPNERE